MKGEYEIPDGVEVRVSGKTVTVKGPLGQLERDFSKMPLVSFRVEGNKIFVETDGDRKRHKMMLNTALAHVKNMITGVTKGYRYRLEVVHVHFPIRVRLQGDEIIVENFLGEKTPRVTRKHGDVTVKIQGKEITVEGINIEHVGQTAANIEQVTRVRSKDRRIFRDGIYLTERGFMNE